MIGFGIHTIVVVSTSSTSSTAGRIALSAIAIHSVIRTTPTSPWWIIEPIGIRRAGATIIIIMAIAVVLGIVVVVIDDDFHCIGVLLLRECIIKILRWFGDDTLIGLDLVLDRSSRSSWGWGGDGGGSSRLATILHLLHHFLLD
jgi:hypothetical protein